MKIKIGRVLTDPAYIKKGGIMKSISISILVCVFIVASGFQAFGEEWTAEQKEVWTVLITNIENFKTGDVDKIMEGLHDDFILWWNDMPIPVEKELAFYRYRAWFKYDIPKNWEIEPLTIKIIGNVASVFYTYKLSGKILSGTGRAMKTWIKQENRWIMINSHSSSCDKLPPCN